MKTCIFILSTAFSGSTMLDLMLANGQDGFSCGELSAYFRPWRPHHNHPHCGCGNPNCIIWPRLKEYGEDQIYTGIFREFPQVKHVVDTSKDISWLRAQNNYLKSQNIKPIYIVLWKDPLEYALSCWKRGKSNGWARKWTDYYSNVFSIIDKWVTVRYKDLAENPQDTLRGLCSKIGIPYFDGKEHFWNGKYHSLFGSDSVKLHLVEKNSREFQELLKARERAKPNIRFDHINESLYHRTIYYDQNYLEKLPEEIRNSDKHQQKIDHIRTILNLTNFSESPTKHILKEVKKRVHPQSWYEKAKTIYWA
jgi:hypothetical protein